MRRGAALLMTGFLVAGASASTSTAGPLPLDDCSDPTITGTEGDDVIRGTPEDDVIAALGGDDVVYARGDWDVICGDDGNDVIAGGWGHDVIRGGSGQDFLRPGLGYRDASYGEAGDDHIVERGSSEGGWMSGGPGDDRLENGMVTYSGAREGVRVDLHNGTGRGEGRDQLVVVFRVHGSRFDDVLAGDAGDNLFDGDEGNDIISGGGGDDYLDGARGDDLISGGNGSDSLYGEASFQDYLHPSGNDRLYGGRGNDRLAGDPGESLLWGNDRIDGGSGRDEASYDMSTASMTIDLEAGTASGNGSDTLIAIENARGPYSEDSVLRGDAGNNRLIGGFGDDHFDGGSGNDVIAGDDGDDIGFTGAGNDVFIVPGCFGNVDFNAGSGRDMLKWDHGCEDHPVHVDLARGVFSGAGGEGSIANFEDVFTLSGDDILLGDDRANLLRGGRGHDDLSGRGGDDRILGGEGFDEGRAGSGRDTCRTEVRADCED